LQGTERTVYRAGWVIDLHTHTLLSDGCLAPAELARRAQVLGAEALVMADHVDQSNVEAVVGALTRAASELGPVLGYTLVAGAEVTHVPPALVADVVERARAAGAGLVLVHGETLVEPVAPGTNRAAIEAGADVVTHPGPVAAADARLAAERGVALEVSARRGHCLTNGHVVVTAREAGATVVFGSDAHVPEDLCDRPMIERILAGAGLGPDEIARALDAAERLAEHGRERMGKRGGLGK